jgi:hypothetical protein
MNVDPYYTYDKHNIQVNVFHVKGPLKGTPQEKDKQLHQDAYLFNPKDSENPKITFPKTNITIINERIYLSDTSEIALHKIASCVNLDKKDIYAWIDREPTKSLECSKPIGINYDEINCMNPFLEKQVDDRFVNMDGTAKLNSKTYLDLYKILNSQFVGESYNIYFTTLEDVKEHAGIFKDDESMIQNGYLKKYFPMMDEPGISRLDEKIEIINSQKSILEYTESLVDSDRLLPVDIRPINLVYENRDENIVIDLFRIFQEFEVTLDVPMIKIQTDNYMDSYVKFYKSGINTAHGKSKEKTITRELFEKWNKNIYISDGYSRPRSVDKINSLTFILYDRKKSNFIQMIFYSNGRIKLYSDRLVKLEKFQNKIIQDFLDDAAEVINHINKNIVKGSKIPEILDQPSRIDVSSIYEISDYNIGVLKKLFNSLYSEFILLTDEDDKLHLLYTKCDDFENMKYLTDFITLCKRLKILDGGIVELLSVRYGITRTKSKEYLDEWININLTKPIRYREEIQKKNISIIIEKVLDRIKVSFYNLSNYGSFHECIDTMNSIMNIYKLKQVDKRKDLLKEINNLFNKTNKKVIVSVQDKPAELISLSEIEPEPEPEPELIEEHEPELIEEPETIHTDEILDDDSDTDSDSEDEYDDIDDELSGGGSLSGQRAGMKGGSSGNMDSNTDGDSKYPNSRYYIKRLELKDPRLIKYKPKHGRDGYSAKCQAAQDKQPIALTRAELYEIDAKVKLTDEQQSRKDKFKNSGYEPEWQNEGISYSKPIQIKKGGKGKDDGVDSYDDIFYICPKFWDRKHQIPIDPLSKNHPIEKDENGKPLEWLQFVWNKDYKNSDGDYFILERSGRSAGKSDSSSYWNKDKDKDNIEKYQVQLIHDDVHPELRALPCCGKKKHKITKKNILVLINDGVRGNQWINGFIKSDAELTKLNSIGKCKVQITQDKGKISRTFHISQIKEYKGQNYNTNILDYTEFPLNENKRGKVNPILKDIFHMAPNAPFFKSGFAAKGREMSHNGFFRLGVVQDSDAFLRSVEILSIGMETRNIQQFKKNLKDDLDNLEIQEIFMIGNGSFVQYFRSGETKYKNDKEMISDLKENFKKYLDSDEPKDDKLLVPLLMKCSENPNNKLFGGERVNILVLHETYEKYNEEIINTKIKLSEPLGGLNIYEGEPFLMIYKKDDYYECLMYYYHSAKPITELSSITRTRDKDPLIKTDVIYISDETAVIQSIKDDEVKIKYDNGAQPPPVPKDECIKFDMFIIYVILSNFIKDCQSKSIHKKKEIIQFEDLHVIMTEKLKYKIVEGYYDNYHKLVCVLYQMKNGRRQTPVFIKPRAAHTPIKLSDDSEVIFSLRKIKTLSNFNFDHILKDYGKIDLYIGELYPNKYLPYLSDKSKVLINNRNITVGYFMENGFIVPLTSHKYNDPVSVYNSDDGKPDIIKCTSALYLQKDQIGPPIEDKYDDYFREYNKKMDDIRISFSGLYDKIMGSSEEDEKLKENLTKIINHPIKLQIHKRFDLYDLLAKIYDENHRPHTHKNLKLFIEYLLIHDLKDLQTILFQNYSSLKDYKMNVSDQSDYIIFNMKEILTESYIDLFDKYSTYIRNISYYEHSNPNVNKMLLKREFIEKPVSSYSKYPHTLKKLFTGRLMIIINILVDERNDIGVISSEHFSELINGSDIRKILLDVYENDDDLYLSHNEILDDKYPSNKELISSISEKSYKLSLVDYEILSEKLGVGFVLFTNGYSNNEQRYKTYIIVHKTLKGSSEDTDKDIKMICLYEDLSGEKVENNECKPILIDGSPIHKLGVLRENREFDRIYKKTNKD